MKSGRPNTALIVTPRYLPLLGGMERECALLAEAFGRLGFRTVVVTEQLDPKLSRHERIGSTSVTRIPSSARRSLATQLLVAARLSGFLLRNKHTVAFAVVRTFTLPALVVGLLKKLRLITYPTFLTAETGGSEDDVTLLQRRPLAPISRSLVSSHDVINGICSANIEHMKEFGLPPDKIAEIPNGIDIAPWNATSAPDRVKRFLFLGRVEGSKGVFELLEAFSELRRNDPEVALTIAGNGEALADLELDDRAAGVTLLGRVAYDDIDELFAGHDCLVLPSYSEGMPLSVLEAAVRHRILVLSDVGDMGALFGEAAYMCRPGDSASLLRALKAASEEVSPSAPYEHVVEKVDIDVVAASIVASLKPVG